jgi:hypothetical protein
MHLVGGLERPWLQINKMCLVRKLISIVATAEMITRVHSRKLSAARRKIGAAEATHTSTIGMAATGENRLANFEPTYSRILSTQIILIFAESQNGSDRSGIKNRKV